MLYFSLQLAIDRSSLSSTRALILTKDLESGSSLNHLHRHPSVDQPRTNEQVLVPMRFIPKLVHMCVYKCLLKQTLVVVVGKSTW